MTVNSISCLKKKKQTCVKERLKPNQETRSISEGFFLVQDLYYSDFYTLL